MDILIDRNMLITVIDTLKKEQKRRTSERNNNNLKQLFADDESDSREKIFLVLSLIKLPPIPENGKVAPMTIKSPIPHSFVDKFTNVLLLTRNIKGHGRDHMPTVHEFKNKLRKHDALGLVSEIMSFKQLRNEYKDFESRRKLARQFDIVLCDKEIIGGVSTCLGKPFYSMKKKPLQINLESKDLKESIEKCLSRSILHLNLVGSSSTVQIGRMNQGSEEIADNILSTMTTWKKLMPGGWINIRSINVKSETSKSLPLFVTTTLPKDVPEVINPYLLEDDVVAEDSVNTISDYNIVKVTRFGDIEVLPVRKKPMENYLKKKQEEEASTTKYDPATNTLIKNGEIIRKSIVRKVYKPKVQKLRLGGRYFKKGKNSAGAKGKGGNKQRDSFLGKNSSNRISKGSQSRKSPRGEKGNLKRKRSARRTTDTGSTKKRKITNE